MSTQENDPAPAGAATADPFRLLTPAEVEAADLPDWGILSGRLRARFRPADYATGLELVARIGAAAEAADHHPELTLTYGDVVVSLTSHDVRGVTARDVRLARRVSALAAELGVPADLAGVRHVELALDTVRGPEQARIYAALTGADVAPDGELVDASQQSPVLWWQGSGGGTPSGHELPEPDVEQRWHLDVWVPASQAQARLRAALDAGARLVSDAAAPRFWVLEDVDGNRACLCTSQERAQA